VHPLEQLRWQVVKPVDQLGRARVGVPGLASLSLRQRERAQREDLVDLGRVEEVARALGGECPSVLI